MAQQIVPTYNCPADAGTLTAQFYNQLDPKTAVLDWKGTQVILFIEQSGSGARYVARTVSHHVSTPLSTALLRGELREGSAARVTLDGDVLQVRAA